MEMGICQFSNLSEDISIHLCKPAKCLLSRVYSLPIKQVNGVFPVYEFIKTEIEDNFFHIILDRTEERNAVNLPMVQEIGQAVDIAEKAFNAGEARVLIIRAEGRVFSQGIDLNALDDYVELFGEQWRENLFATTRTLQDVLTKIERSSLPSICLIHGYCIGTGFEIALACDFRIVAERTRISLPETRLGIVPDVGGTVRLVNLIGASRAKEVILTGRTIKLNQAEQWGMINTIVPKNELMTKANELAEEIKLSAPMAVNYAKRIINDIVDNQRGLNIEAWAQAALFRSEDFQAGVDAMRTKNYPIEWKNK